MASDFDDHDGPVAGPSSVDSPYASFSPPETPPAVSYLNLGAGTKVTPHKFKRDSYEIVNCRE
jgi:hypothetical protein